MRTSLLHAAAAAAQGARTFILSSRGVGAKWPTMLDERRAPEFQAALRVATRRAIWGVRVDCRVLAGEIVDPFDSSKRGSCAVQLC